jgi:pheromone shutdown protein TraB
MELDARERIRAGVRPAVPERGPDRVFFHAGAAAVLAGAYRSPISEEKHHLRTPTSQLPHEEKLKRQQFHLRVLMGVLLLVLAMLAYSAAFDLDHWAEWIVFGGIVFTAIGVMIAVNPRDGA